VIGTNVQNCQKLLQLLQLIEFSNSKLPLDLELLEDDFLLFALPCFSLEGEDIFCGISPVL